MRLLAALLLACAALGAEPGLMDTKAEVFFSPGDGCAEAVMREVAQAKESVLVQAYSFTSAPIAQAMVDAHKRGVKVYVILDKRERDDPSSCADFLVGAGVHVKIDARHTKAHNKVVIIDQAVVLTGSFNFSSASEDRISDNLLVLHSKELAAKYVENWQIHFEQAKKYRGREQQ